MSIFQLNCIDFIIAATQETKLSHSNVEFTVHRCKDWQKSQTGRGLCFIIHISVKYQSNLINTFPSTSIATANLATVNTTKQQPHNSTEWFKKIAKAAITFPYPRFSPATHNPKRDSCSVSHWLSRKISNPETLWPSSSREMLTHPNVHFSEAPPWYEVSFHTIYSLASDTLPLFSVVRYK